MVRLGTFAPHRSRRSGVAAGVAVAALTLLGFTSSALAVPVSVGHSGWGWGNPLPQGNTLSGLDFAGSRGYAAGDFGTLLRTDDAGASWTGVSTGLTDALVRVRAIGPNSVVVGGGCALRRSDDGGQTFTRLPWTASDRDCESEIASFYFPSAAVGYLVAGDGTVFRTADGGQTFSRQTSVPGTASAGGSREPADVLFVSDSTGIAITRGGGPGKIFRTTDSGNSWKEVASWGTALNGLAFPTREVGYAVGSSNTMLSTADGGVTWQAMSLNGAPGGLDLTRLDCADAATCLITQANGGNLLRTTDGGATATAITPATNAVLAAAFASPSRAVAVGGRGVTVISNDGGVNWGKVGGSVAGQFTGRLRATSPQLATVGAENGILARTLDGGVSWATVGVPTTGAVTDASFPSPDLGYALDSAGGAFKTANGGASWQILNTGAQDAPRALLATASDRVLLVGPKGVRRSTNAGASFESVGDRDVRRAKLANVDPAGSAVLAFGRKSLRVSKNGGGTWSRVRLPGGKLRVRDADFATARVGFVLATDGRLLRTTNGGRKWKELTALGTDDGTEISFSDRRRGYVTVSRYATGDFGYAFRTTNAGKTFQPQLISATALSGLWDTGQVGVAVTPEGSFFETPTGGEAGTSSKLKLKQKGGRKRPHARPKRKVKVSGKLRPSEGGEPIVISIRTVGKRDWDSRIEPRPATAAFRPASRCAGARSSSPSGSATTPGPEPAAGRSPSSRRSESAAAGRDGDGDQGNDRLMGTWAMAPSTQQALPVSASRRARPSGRRASGLSTARRASST